MPMDRRPAHLLGLRHSSLRHSSLNAYTPLILSYLRNLAPCFIYGGCLLLLLHDRGRVVFQSAWDVVGLQTDVKCTLPMYKFCC
jgi:hypothetical protein